MVVNNSTFGLPSDVTDIPISLIRKVMLIRRTEEKLLSLFAEGKLFGTVHTCIGQEWSGVAVAESLVEGDLVFSNHRCHGHFLARTDDVDGLVAEIMGRTTGVCAGWGGSQHLYKNGFFSNGIQGGIVPVAAGLALAEEFKGTQNIAVVYIGDGTLGEGAVYEAANIIAKWNIPLLIVLENNRYSQSTSQSETLAGDIDSRFSAFGIRCYSANTWNPSELLLTAKAAISEVRTHRVPAFLRVDTDRLMAHSKSDDNRSPDELQEYWKRDHIHSWAQANAILAEQLRSEVDERIDRAVQAAMQAPYAVAPTLPRSNAVTVTWRAAGCSLDDGKRNGEIVRETLDRHMKHDPRVVLLGEDIRSPYGGAFKVTKGLSDVFGDRVRNTPISESSIVGIGNGLALGGIRPICEIMFGDFLTLAFDQFLNHACKFEYMYGRQVQVPIVVRTPMGGKRGYGPTHSQSIEKSFLGLAQLRVLAINSLLSPAVVYDALLSLADMPTLVIENKLLYSMRLRTHVADGFVLEYSDETFPTTRIRPLAQPDVTIFCYGGSLPDVETAAIQAFDREEIVCEVICPTQIHPLNPVPVLESIQKTRRLVVVEEGAQFAGLGAELAAQIQEMQPGILTSFVRISGPDHPLPSCGPLEQALLPGPETILAGICRSANNG